MWRTLRRNIPFQSSRSPRKQITAQNVSILAREALSGLERSAHHAGAT